MGKCDDQQQEIHPLTDYLVECLVRRVVVLGGWVVPQDLNATVVIITSASVLVGAVCSLVLLAFSSLLVLTLAESLLNERVVGGIRGARCTQAERVSVGQYL